jgi:predicted esterase
MKNLLCLLLLCLCACASEAQIKIPCAIGRYEKDLFQPSATKTVQFGSSKNWSGATVNLNADIYEPKGDTATLRPMIIFAHGGGYVQGNKTDMAFFAQQFTKKGYVTASIDYRLLPISRVRSINDMKREIVMAMNDFKMAIKFFRANAKTYKIDPNNIFIGGASAGAITALHIGLLDADDKMPDDFAKIVADEGGLEAVKVKGVINYSGSILEEDWVDNTDAPIFSYHGTADDVVPIGYGITGSLFNMYGSENIKAKADAAGLPNILVKAPNGGHTNIYTDSTYTSFYLDFHNKLNAKMRSMMCAKK